MHSAHATKNAFRRGFGNGFVQIWAGYAKCAASRIGKSDGTARRFGGAKFGKTSEIMQNLSAFCENHIKQPRAAQIGYKQKSEIAPESDLDVQCQKSGSQTLFQTHANRKKRNYFWSR